VHSVCICFQCNYSKIQDIFILRCSIYCLDYAESREISQDYLAAQLVSAAAHRTRKRIHLLPRRSSSFLPEGLRIPECHAAKPLDWDSWICKWRVDAVASLPSRFYCMWLPSVELCIGKFFVPPLPLDTDELNLRTTAAFEKSDRNILERIRDELDYTLDICRIMNGAHCEHIQGIQRFLFKLHYLQMYISNTKLRIRS
jgi:hypothetical protein